MAKAIFNEKYAQMIEDVDSTCPASIDLHRFYLSLVPREAGSDEAMAAGRDQFEHWGDTCAEPAGVDYIEEKIGEAICLWAKPHGANHHKAVICIHGGAYLFGSRFSHRKSYAHIAKAIGCDAVIVDYRLLPEHDWNVPIMDVGAVYAHLLNNGYKPEDVAVIGDSAGGAMSIALPHLAREMGLPLPAAAMAISPWIDCMATTDIYEYNRRDFLNPRQMVIGQGEMLQSCGADIHNPLLAPIHFTEEQLKDYSPVYIQVGGIENFIDEAEIFAEKLYQAGGEVKLDILENMQHSFTQLAGRCVNADKAIERYAEWCKPFLGL